MNRDLVDQVSKSSMGTVNIPVQTPGAGQRLNMEQFLCWAMTALCKVQIFLIDLTSSL